MLIVTRRIAEKIVVTHRSTGQRLEIVLVQSGGTKAKIGVAASENEFTINREEVQQLIDANTK